MQLSHLNRKFIPKNGELMEIRSHWTLRTKLALETPSILLQGLHYPSFQQFTSLEQLNQSSCPVLKESAASQAPQRTGEWRAETWHNWHFPVALLCVLPLICIRLSSCALYLRLSLYPNFSYWSLMFVLRHLVSTDSSHHFDLNPKEQYKYFIWVGNYHRFKSQKREGSVLSHNPKVSASKDFWDFFLFFYSFLFCFVFSLFCSMVNIIAELHIKHYMEHKWAIIPIISTVLKSLETWN